MCVWECVCVGVCERGTEMVQGLWELWTHDHAAAGIKDIHRKEIESGYGGQGGKSV